MPSSRPTLSQAESISNPVRNTLPLPLAPSPPPSRADLQALDWIITFIYERSRIRLSRNKEALIRARLGKRMRALGIDDLSGYCALLDSPEGVEEVGRAVDALTTNFTHFLREREHFQYMIEEALPRLLAPGQKRFNIWSAACATGEEPYTIALFLAERFPPAEGWDWRMLATDISSRALEESHPGRLPRRSAGESAAGLDSQVFPARPRFLQRFVPYQTLASGTDHLSADELA